MSFSLSIGNVQRHAGAIAAMAILAIGAGLITGFLEERGFVRMLIAVLVLVIILKPRIGFMAFVASIPFEAQFLIEGISLSRIIGLVTIIAWIAQKLVRREKLTDLLSGRLTVLLILYVALASASVFWAQYQAHIPSRLFTLVQLLALYLLVSDQIDSWKTLRGFVYLWFIAATTSTIYGIFQYFVLNVPRAGEDTIGTPNEYAAMIILTLPFMLLAISSRETPWPLRLLAIAMLPMSLLGIAVSFSRTGFIVLPVTLLLHFLADRNFKRNTILLAVISLAAILAMQYIPWENVTNRAMTILEPALGYEPILLPSEALIPRDYIWRVAIAIFLTSPFVGVGYYNFGYYFTNQYQFIVPGNTHLSLSPRSPHSLYLGILADLGIVGFGLLLAIISQVFYMWHRIRQSLASDPYLYRLAGTLRTGLIAYLIFSSTEYTEYSKLLWLFFGVTQATYFLATRAETQDTEKETQPRAPLGGAITQG